MVWTLTRVGSPRKGGKNRTGMGTEASSQSKIMVISFFNPLLAKTGTCQVGEDCLHLTDLGEGRGNKFKVFNLKRLWNVPASQWDVWVFLLLLSGLVICQTDLPAPIDLSRECLKGKHNTPAGVGFWAFSWSMQKEFEFERPASSVKALPSEPPGILWFAWFVTAFKTVPVHLCSFSELKRACRGICEMVKEV